MWAMRADPSSEDDEHNTGHTLVLLFADAYAAPALLSHFSELDSVERPKDENHPCCE